MLQSTKPQQLQQASPSERCFAGACRHCPGDCRSSLPHQRESFCFPDSSERKETADCHAKQKAHTHQNSSITRQIELVEPRHHHFEKKQRDEQCCKQPPEQRHQVNGPSFRGPTTVKTHSRTTLYRRR